MIFQRQILFSISQWIWNNVYNKFFFSQGSNKKPIFFSKTEKRSLYNVPFHKSNSVLSAHTSFQLSFLDVSTVFLSGKIWEICVKRNPPTEQVVSSLRRHSSHFFLLFLKPFFHPCWGQKYTNRVFKCTADFVEKLLPELLLV